MFLSVLKSETGMKEHAYFFCSCSVLVLIAKNFFCSCSVLVLGVKNFFVRVLFAFSEPKFFLVRVLFAFLDFFVRKLFLIFLGVKNHLCLIQKSAISVFVRYSIRISPPYPF